MSISLPPEILLRLQKLSLHLRKSVLGSRQGKHRSLRRGHGLEFSEYKSYSPGDDFRNIDWNVLARTDKIYTRQYREEQDVKLLLVLDSSKSLYSVELSRQIALSVSYVALHNGDKVSLLLPEVSQSPWSSAPASYHNIRKYLESFTPTTTNKLFESIGKATSEMKVPGRVILISDLLFPLPDFQKTCEYLYIKNLETSIVTIDSMSLFKVPAGSTLIDSETNEKIDAFISDNELAELKKHYTAHFYEIDQICAKYNFTNTTINAESKLEDALFQSLISGGILK